jgi:hypothetical protein
MNIQQLKADYIISRLVHLNLNELLASSLHYSRFLETLLIIISLFLILLIIRRVLVIRGALKAPSVILEITPPAFTEIGAYTTEQLFSVIHNLGERRTLPDKLLGRKVTFSFEIISTLKEGIRYLVRVVPEEAANFKRNLISYLPQVSVKAAEDYLPADLDKQSGLYTKILEFKLKRHFAYPLKKQDTLKEHDPVAYITGMMTKLSPAELVSFQIVLSPTQKGETKAIKEKILHGEDVLAYLNKLIKLPGIPVLNTSSSQIKPRVFTSFQQEVVASIEEKIDQPLFETKIRILVSVKNKNDLRERIKGFSASLSVFSVPGYQAIRKKRTLSNKLLFLNFKKRLLSLLSNTSSDLLSVSEISALFHFPFTQITRTENIVKLHSKDLPAPLSLKKENNLDVIFGKNVYGGTTTNIGLTSEERLRHMYIIGATGTGKTTIILSMAVQDIKSGRGVCVIDPHGDLAEGILSTIPEKRRQDFIYFNPDDIGYPMGVNLLEVTPGLGEDNQLREKELITESVISLFRKIFSEVWSTHAHRIEYILRNTIQTALTTENPTLFTVYELLTNPDYQMSVTNKLEDKNLQNFWKYEFGKAGDFQRVKMISPVTSRIGRFLFSPSAKRILEQEKSTINFDEILDSGKILICNLSKGKLGEDTSEVLGILILTKIQLAALKRARKPVEERKPFYLYVDEFQNFATPSFIQMLSEARKYKLNLVMAEQSTSQQKDKNLVSVVLANVGTTVSFRSANPDDEKLMLPQFAPYVIEGEIANLPSFHFYTKINALNPEEPFSGETVPVKIEADKGKINSLIESSRSKYAIIYVKPKKEEVLKETTKKGNKTKLESRLPDK